MEGPLRVTVGVGVPDAMRWLGANSKRDPPGWRRGRRLAAAERQRGDRPHGDHDTIPQ
jgi:hypothetical protein